MPSRFSDSLYTLYKERRLKGERKGERGKVSGKESKKKPTFGKRKVGISPIIYSILLLLKIGMISLQCSGVQVRNFASLSHYFCLACSSYSFEAARLVEKQKTGIDVTVL